MIEPTDEMVRAFSDADFSGCGNADWDDSHVRIGLAAAIPIVVRNYAARVEGKRGDGLCDCDGTDGDPISPVDGEPLEHHCECLSVLTAAELLGGLDKTQHAARCLCGRLR
jgi:hypothetical protein